MKAKLLSHVIGMFLLFSIQTVLAQGNAKISIQGTLKDANGSAVDDGTYTVTFKLYNAETGGTSVWSEEASVEVVGGIYSHYLGSVNALNPEFFGGTLWLALRVGSYELQPRTELTYAPYALSVAFAQEVVCAGAVGDVKYSILNPSQFQQVNGDCWVPMDGRELATSDRLRQITGMTALPNAGGYFLRAQEFSTSGDIDPSRTSGSPIATAQNEDIKSHNHTGTTDEDGAHSHGPHTTARADNDDNDTPHNFVTYDNANYYRRRDFYTNSENSAHIHAFTTNNTGGDETRPKNMNFWIYIRIN